MAVKSLFSFSADLRAESWTISTLFFNQKIVIHDMLVNFVKDKFFKNFCQGRKKTDWTVIGWIRIGVTQAFFQ